MKAAVYFGPEDIRTVDVDDPKITEPHQMLVKVRATSICGSDLHIWRGTLDQAMGKGHSTLGHELSGEVVETGASVGRFKAGDRVSMAYSASCGDCFMCRVGNTAHCETTKSAVYGYGVGFGDLNGTQAEYLVIPYADAHTMKVDDALDDRQALTLSCNLPTAVLANKLVDVQIGESLAVVGLGPTGMMALDLAMKRNPGKVFAFEPVEHRRRAAEERYGVQTFAPGEEGVEAVKEATGGRGVDKVIEMVGTGDSLDLCYQLVRAGGTIAGLKAVLTDNGREFCGTENHPYELYLDLNDIEHRRTKVRSPKTNGFVERFNRTVLDEFFRVKMRETFYETVEALQADLDAWLVHYNTERPHLGYRNQGRRPIETVMSFVSQDG